MDVGTASSGEVEEVETSEVHVGPQNPNIIDATRINSEEKFCILLSIFAIVAERKILALPWRRILSWRVLHSFYASPFEHDTPLLSSCTKSYHIIVAALRLRF